MPPGWYNGAIMATWEDGGAGNPVGGRLESISLCVLVDGRGGPAACEEMVGRLLDAGVRMIQIRDKHLTVPELTDAVRRAAALAARHRPDPAIIVVNDRADVAAAVGTGVHLGRDDLPVELARRILGTTQPIGRTAHDLAEARAATVAGADYLGIGPCFPSLTKRFAAHADPDFLRGVVGEIRLPAFAIGGVTLERLGELAALGITRVAVAAAITAAADPAAAAREFLARLPPRGP